VNAATSVTATFNTVTPPSCQPGSVATYYISTSGSDTNPGTQALPFRHLQWAYDNKAAAGVTFIVMPGTYSSSGDYHSGWGLWFYKNGTASQPITFCSQTRGGAIIDGLNGTDRHLGVWLGADAPPGTGGNYHVIDGFVVTGGPQGGFTMYGNYNKILRNVIHHNGNNTTQTTNPTNGQSGISSDPATHDNVYMENYIHHNGRLTDSTYGRLDHGFYVCGDNELIINNVAVYNSGIGLQIAGNDSATVSGMKVYNNTFAFNRNGVVFEFDMLNIDFRNNIVFGNISNGIYGCDSSGSGVVIDHNLIYGNATGGDPSKADIAMTGQCDYNTMVYSFSPNPCTPSTMSTLCTISADPQFSDGSGNFSLQSDFGLKVGSPAVDLGLTLALVPIDIAGTRRPLGAGTDVGALESR
jgi:hypothetical protein